MSHTNASVLEVRGLLKRFPGVVALDNVSLTIRQGEIHALMGENGAGKSTLAKILTGVYLPEAGEILWKGNPLAGLSPAQIRELGISAIYQESSLVPWLSVGENIYLGRLPARFSGLVDWRRLHDSCRQLLAQLDVGVAPNARVHRLSAINQRMVEVARSLSIQADLIIMDEPTAALSAHEIDILFDNIRSLRERGVAVLYISHFLEEVFEIADRISVLRDGRLVETVDIAETTPSDIVYMMVGRRLGTQMQSKVAPAPDVLLRIEGLTRQGAFYDVSFDLHAGEVLGLTGPVSSGKTALARALFGIDRGHSGRMRLRDQIVNYRLPADAIGHGLGLLPQNRRKEGLLLDASVVRNIALPSLNRLSKFGLVDKDQEKRLAQTYVERLAIKTSSLTQRVRYLSGGNQQKVVISKWLALSPQVLILDEPAQGIDVGAKEEIYSLVLELAGRGIGILYISSEPAELARLCHRVLIMRRGRIVSRLTHQDITRERIVEEVTGAGGT